MQRTKWLLGIALATVASAIAPTHAIAQTTQAMQPADTGPVTHGRISFTDQSALVKGTSDADWSYAGVNSLVMPGDTVWADDESALEIEFTGGTFLRLADSSKLEVKEAPPSALFRGDTGSFYVQRLRTSTGDVTFDTPVGAIEIAPDTQVRIDILEEGDATVTVRWGAATIHSEGGQPVTVRAGERSLIDPGFLPSQPIVFDRSEEDAFDTWNRSRARTLAEGNAPNPIQSSYAGGVAPMGVSDLNGYGEWVYVDNQPYWRPTVVDYVPYRYGSWSYVPAQGYVWVDYYPWAYCTTHYGYWRYTPRYGWCWGYYGAYRPAYAYTVHYGDRFVWAPMDYYGYPCHYGSYSSFTIGGVNWSFGFSTWSYDYAVWGGGYHNVFVVNYGHIYDDHHHHHHNDCDYWRIDSDPSPYKNSGKPHWPGDRVNTFAPDRVYRGATVAADGTTRAPERAKALEARQVTRTARNGEPIGFGERRSNAQKPDVPSSRAREATRQVRIASPDSTRVARVPDRINDQDAGGRTYTNKEARGAAPLSRGSRTIAKNSPVVRDRANQDSIRDKSAARTERVYDPNRGRGDQLDNGSTDAGKATRPEAPGQRPSKNGAPDSVNQDRRPEVVRPRPTFDRPKAGDSNPQPQINDRPRPEYTRPVPQNTRPTVTRPQIAESDPQPQNFDRPRPEKTRPVPQSTRPTFNQPDYQPERQQQYSRPEPTYERPQAPQPAPQPQYSQPEPQRPQFGRPESQPQPSFERQQQYSRPEPQYSRPEPQYSAPQAPRVESRPPTFGGGGGGGSFDHGSSGKGGGGNGPTRSR